MLTIKFSSVVFGIMSKLPAINKIHWCMALGHPSPAINKCCCLLLPAMSVSNLPRSGSTVFMTCDGHTINDTQWSELLVKTSDFFHIPPAFDAPVRGPCRNITVMVCRNQNGAAIRLWKNFQDMFTRFDRIHKHCRHPDRCNRHHVWGVITWTRYINSLLLTPRDGMAVLMPSTPRQK